MRKAVLYIVCIGIVLGLQACTKENLDDCFYGLRLRVSYAFGTDSADAPAPEVRHARAYVFNEDNVLCAIAEAKGSLLLPGNEIDIKLAPGKYKVLVWGSDNTDLFHSYGEGISTTAGTGYTQGVTIGKTVLSDFRLFLKGSVSQESPQAFIPADNQFNDLYYGITGTRTKSSAEYIVKEVQIPDYTVVEENVELIRNTNVLRISITGLQYLLPEGATADIYALGRGESYKWDNTFGATSGSVKSCPYNMLLDEDGLTTFDMKLQRIRMDSQSEKPLMLYICDKVQGTKLYELNVLENLVKVRNEEGNYIYRNQEDMDRLYIHNVGLEFLRPAGGGTSIVVKIYIDGWEIKQIHPVH